MGKPPMPHQQYIWDVALEIDERSGLFAYSTVVVVGPRQVTGKTEQILPALVHRCTGVNSELVAYARRELGKIVPEPGPQRVFFTAQTADDARTRWRDVHVARIANSPMRRLWAGPPRLTQNKESMFWVNGSTWVPGSTTGKTGGTGDTIDMGVIDEAWSRTDNRTELSLRPAMMTRPWSQLWLMSMVPGPSRVAPGEWPYLKNKMLTGRQRVEADMRRGTCYIEFSAPDDADPGHPDTWWSCMPGLGFTVPEERVAEDYEAMPLEDFKAEYLGIIPTGQAAAWRVISRENWQALRLREHDYADPVALGVDATPDLASSSIAMAAQMPNGDVHVELIERRDGVNWLQDAILTLCGLHSVCAVGVDRNGPLAGLVRPLQRRAIDLNLVMTILEASSAEVAAACAQFFNMTGGQDDADASDAPATRRVRHLGQPELTQSVGGVLQHRTGDRWRWDRDDSTADTSPIFAATLALAAGERHEWIGGAYDIKDSLG